MEMGDEDAEKDEMPQIVLFCWDQLNVLIVCVSTTKLYMYN